MSKSTDTQYSNTIGHNNNNNNNNSIIILFRKVCHSFPDHSRNPIGSDVVNFSHHNKYRRINRTFHEQETPLVMQTSTNYWTRRYNYLQHNTGLIEYAPIGYSLRYSFHRFVFDIGSLSSSFAVTTIFDCGRI